MASEHHFLVSAVGTCTGSFPQSFSFSISFQRRSSSGRFLVPKWAFSCMMTSTLRAWSSHTFISALSHILCVLWTDLYGAISTRSRPRIGELRRDTQSHLEWYLLRQNPRESWADFMRGKTRVKSWERGEFVCNWARAPDEKPVCVQLEAISSPANRIRQSKYLKICLVRCEFLIIPTAAGFNACPPKLCHSIKDSISWKYSDCRGRIRVNVSMGR